jgi:hypothetical protein
MVAGIMKSLSPILTLLCLCLTSLGQSKQPLVKTITIASFKGLSVPDNRGNEILSKSFYEALDAAHRDCGLNAVGFQENIQKLQKLSVGTDFQELAERYCSAARFCHLLAVKPSSFTREVNEEEKTNKNLKVEPKAKINIGAGGLTVDVAVPVENQKEDWSKKRITELVEFLPTSSPLLHQSKAKDTLDWTYDQVVDILKSSGLPPQFEEDLIGAWIYHLPDGSLEIYLHQDRKAQLKWVPNKINWFDKLIGHYKAKGVWHLRDGKWTVTVNKWPVGRDSFFHQKYIKQGGDPDVRPDPGTLDQIRARMRVPIPVSGLDVSYFGRPPFFFFDDRLVSLRDDKILLEDGTELTRLKKSKK